MGLQLEDDLDLKKKPTPFQTPAFDRAYNRTLGFEGGFTIDHAGPTNRGITQTTYSNYLVKNNLPYKNVKDASLEETKKIYEEEFFKKPKFDKLPDGISDVAFDFGVNAGTFTSTKALQEVVGAKVDGVLGPKTQKAVNDFVQKNGEKPLIKKLIDKQENHYKTLIQKHPARFQRFEKGWMNRIQKLRQDLSSLNPFAVNEAEAGEIPKLGLIDDLNLTTPKEEKPLIPKLDLEDDLELKHPNRSPEIPQLRSATPSDPTKSIDVTKEAFDLSVQKMADDIFTAHTGLTPEQGIEGQEKLSQVMARAPLAATAIGAPIAALAVEIYGQAKNVLVDTIKKEDYSPLQVRMLSELIPDDQSNVVKIGATAIEVLSDVALLGGLTNLAKKGLLEDSVKTISDKLRKAGYTEFTVNKQAVKDAVKGTTLDEEAIRWAKAKTAKVNPKEELPKLEKPVSTEKPTSTVPPKAEIVEPGASQKPILDEAKPGTVIDKGDTAEIVIEQGPVKPTETAPKTSAPSPVNDTWKLSPSEAQERLGGQVNMDLYQRSLKEAVEFKLPANNEGLKRYADLGEDWAIKALQENQPSTTPPPSGRVSQQGGDTDIKIDKDSLVELWGNGKPVEVNNEKYIVQKNSGGAYFLEPFGKRTSERDVVKGTIPLQKIDNYTYGVKPGINKPSQDMSLPNKPETQPKELTPFEKMRKAKDEKTLNTKVRYSEGVMTRKEYLEKSFRGGATSRVYEYDNNSAIERLKEERRYLSKDGMQNINAEKIAEIDDKIKAGVKKTEYHIVDPDESFLTVGKTEYDYFNSLKKSDTSISKAEAEIAKTSEAVKGKADKAVFKVKIGKDWQVPVDKAKPEGMEVGQVGSQKKSINDTAYVKAIKNTLTDIEESVEGEYLVIKGYPKKELSSKEAKSIGGYDPIRAGDFVTTKAKGFGGGAGQTGEVIQGKDGLYVKLPDGKIVPLNESWTKTSEKAPQLESGNEQKSSSLQKDALERSPEDVQPDVSALPQSTINDALSQAKTPTDPTDPAKLAKDFDGEFELPDENIGGAFRRVVEDFNIRLKHLTKAIEEKTGEQIKEVHDIWAQKDMLPRQQGDIIRRIRDEKRDFVKMLVKDGVTVEEVDRYLLALHAKERNAQMNKQLAAIGKPPVDGLSGMTDIEASNILKTTDTRLAKYSIMVRKINNDILDFEVAEGMMRREEVERLRAMYKNYIPLQRDIDEDFTGIGMGSDIRGKEFKRAKGSRLRVTSPLGNTFAQKERVYVRSLKNKIGRSIVDMVKEYPFLEELFKVEKEPMAVIAKATRKAEVDQQFVEDLVNFAKSLGLRVFETKAKLRGGALGLYWPGWKGVQRRFATSRETLAHEMGHFFDDKFKLKSKFYKNKKATREVGQEIYVHSEKEVGESANRLAKVEERFANAFSWWLTHRDLAKQTMPLFDQEMMKIIKENPEMEPLLTIKPTPRPSMEAITEDVWGRVDRVGNDVIGTKIDGAQYYITVRDQGLANALKNINLARVPRYVQALRSMLGVWSAFKTRLKPEFLVTNFQRDLGEALVNLGVEKSMLADKAKNLRRDIIKDLPGSQKQLWKYIKGNQEDPVVDEFFKLGGDTGHFWIETAKETEKTLLQLEQEAKNLGFEKVKNVGRAAMDFVDAINSTVELGIRFATYKQLLARGFSKNRAIQSVADLTVNFSRQGEASPLLKSFYGFINPAIQGTSKVARSITGPVGRKRVIKSILGLALMGFLTRMLSIMLDEEGDDQIPDWTKNHKISFAIGGGKQIYLWSLPYGFNTFYAMGSNLASVTFGKKTAGEATASVFETAANSFSPFGTKLNDLMPTLARPIFDINQNQGWYGGRIHNDQMFAKSPKPNSQVYFDRTAKSWIFIAQTMNRLTGGNDKKAGLLDASPEDYQYLYDQYFGGPFEFATSTIEAGAQGLNGEFDPNETPFVRQFYREGKPQQFAYGVIYDTLENARKKDVSPLQRERFFEAVDIGLENKLFDKDKANEFTRDFLKAVYQIEGDIESQENRTKINSMSSSDRSKLRRAYKKPKF